MQHSIWNFAFNPSSPYHYYKQDTNKWMIHPLTIIVNLIFNQNNMNKVLIVDASDSDRRLMTGLLVKSGYEPFTVETMEAAKVEVAKLPPGAVIVAGLRFGGGTAEELVKWLRRERKDYPVIAIVERLGDPEATKVMADHGAMNVVQRPAIDKQLPEMMAKYVRDIDMAVPPDEKLIERPSEEFRKIKEKIARLAATDSNVIIFGESGMGKEQIAREIYRRSNRLGKNLIVIEAGGAALVGDHNPTSERSEMYNRIAGYFKNASGGTIIMKNVHLLNFEKQSVLLHILTEEHPDVRVICTAEPELLDMVSNKTFRSNLFFNLRELDITVVPLRRVSEDIQPVAEYYLRKFAEENGKPVKRLDASAVKELRLHDWPGNIRELANTIHLAVTNVEGEVISGSDIVISRSSPHTMERGKLRDPTIEKQMIADAMAQTGGNITQAAKLLGVGRTSLTYKLHKYGLK